MLASGDRPLFDALAPELGKMTGKYLYLGPSPDRAAAFKLFGNMFLMFVTAGLADVLALAKALEISGADAMALFDQFNPGAMVAPRAKRILSGDFEHTSWGLGMARKDARLMLEEAERNGVPLAVLPAIAKEMDRWIVRGHAQDDWTVIAKDSLASK
jgi:3-hydroxyisobutyrate dehydrogenase